MDRANFRKQGNASTPFISTFPENGEGMNFYQIHHSKGRPQGCTIATRSLFTPPPGSGMEKLLPCSDGDRNETAGPNVIRETLSTSKGVDLNMTLAATLERSAVHSNVVALPDSGKEEEVEPQRTGPSESSGVKIPYPCCPKEKVVVFPGAHGCSSIKCPNCGKYALFDYDNLTAKPGKVCRGAGKRPRAN